MPRCARWRYSKANLRRGHSWADECYSIADMALFAYASRAEEAGQALDAYPHFRAWIMRVEAQPGFLATMHPYAIDPHTAGELP